MSTVLEKEIESYLTKRIKQSSGLSFKWLSSVSGVPDRIVFLNQKAHLVELKTPTGKLSPRQELVFKDLANQGFKVHVVRSKQDVEEFINGVMQC